MSSYLRLRNVVKSYDGKTNAVDDVSINVARGEFVTFLGPSGSGKTTTLLMIAGFENPSGGTIELDGRNLTLSRPYRRNIGMVFQNYALFPHMTAQENVTFPLRMRHFPKGEIAQRAEKMLALVGLSAFAQRYPRELSGGQQQRVALARGLVFNPDVVLLDEPLGALDKNLREQMQVEIKRIHRELGITTIYVTHDQTEAMTMSDRIAVFSNGRLAQVDTPLDVYQRPSNRFVAEFVGDSNFFAGTVDASRPGMADLTGIGRVRIPPKTTLIGDVDSMIRPERLQPTHMVDAVDANEFEMTVVDTINYGDSILVIGTTRGVPLRARLVGTRPDMLRPGATLRLAWAPADAHVLARR
ncbi:MAG TPA: ABC transporter ATP-binding protein [Xanthobacteraceae bacterium]|nr:ABC transporter ATP-binding protein [Xanthobacteraceae bacterium]